MSTGSTAGHFDLSNLPAVVLVEVLSYLSLKELFNVSLVCRRLRDLFGHPTLWRRLTVVIQLKAQRYREPVRRWLERNRRALQPWVTALDKMADHVRHVTVVLETETGMRRLHPRLQACLSCIGDRLVRLGPRLTGLTLRARLPPKFHPAPLLPALAVALSTAPCLSCLHDNLLCRPPDVVFKQGDVTVNDPDQGHPNEAENRHWNVFRLLQLPGLSASLTSLELWGEETMTSLGEYQVALRVLMARAVTSLTALRALSVWHLLLDSTVVAYIADRSRPAKLRMLRVHFLHVHTAPNRKPPVCDVSEDGWGELCSSNPGLSFQLFSHPGFPTTWLADVISCSLPVTHLRVASWNETLTSRLTCAGQRALRELHLQAANVTVGGSVLEVVELSTQLCDVRFAGSITPRDVRRLAGMRGPRWRRLEIFAPFVTSDSTAPSSQIDGGPAPQHQPSKSCLPSPPVLGSCLPSTPHSESGLPCTHGSCVDGDFRNVHLSGSDKMASSRVPIFRAEAGESTSTARTGDVEQLERDVSEILGREWHLDNSTRWWH